MHILKFAYHGRIVLIGPILTVATCTEDRNVLRKEVQYGILVLIWAYRS